MFPTGVQIYSVRDHAERDFFSTLEKLKNMGYDGVEFAGLYGYKPKEVKEYCEKLNLVPVSAHVSIDDMLVCPDEVFAAYQIIGCEYIAIPYLTEDRRPGGANYENTFIQIASLGEKAKLHGLTLLYHNHDFEFCKTGSDNKYFLDVLYETVSPAFLQTELDTCWVNVGGENPAEYLIKYTGRSPVVHIKDFVKKSKDSKSGLYELIGITPAERQAEEDDFAFRPLGYGVQDIPSIIAAAKTAGSKWLIVEQDRTCLGLDSLECMKLSAQYLKKVNI
ncbi:MAG: sugar phosphate isomerase/epimerase [Eubacteriales bacterium]|nr:sugar phosphate isomerase/epimerase [Eubacteriales bacterium]